MKIRTFIIIFQVSETIMKYILSAVIFVVTIVINSECMIMPISPCPNIFQYKNDKERKYGIISISGKRQGTTILEATIAVPDEINYVIIIASIPST